MGQSIPFVVGVWANAGKVWEAMTELQEVDVAISSLETLFAARDTQRTVMNFILEPLKLSTGMDGLALASVSILVKDGCVGTEQHHQQ